MSKKKPAPAPPIPEELQSLIDAGWDELQLKTRAHQAAWGHGEEEEWNLDQDEGDLVFTFADGTEARCPAQIIGTFDSKAGTWMWAWHNPSVVRALQQDAQALKALGEEKGFAILTEPTWPCDEMDCWRMVALAAKVCDRQGAYRGPAGTTYVFMTFGEVTLETPGKRRT
jgi:hypothetical protein